MRSQIGVFAALLAAASAHSTAFAEQAEVLLFGQPCRVEAPAGSFSSEQLRAIHLVSPEQTPAADSPAALRTSLERLRSAVGVPESFRGYMDARQKNLEKRLKFEEILESTRRTGARVEFAQGTADFFPRRRHAALVSRFEKALKSGPSPKAWEDLRQFFGDYSGPDGEEDFHRTLRRLKIQYRCSF